MSDSGPEESEAKKPNQEPIVTSASEDDEEGKKTKRTRGLRTIQCAENRLTKAGRTLAEALEEGLNTYREERKKSAEKKRDGALVDFVDNFAAGFAEAQKEAAPASEDIITAFSTKRTKKQFRRAVRTLSSFFPFIR
jgi:hypothetical protein